MLNSYYIHIQFNKKKDYYFIHKYSLVRYNAKKKKNF